MKTKYGFPVVSVNNVFGILKDFGISSWPRVGEPVSLESYLKQDLTLEQIEDLRFAPKSEVVVFRTNKKSLFTGFRLVGYHDGVVTFTLLPDNLLPICAEFRHGCEELVLDLPGGLIDSDEGPAVWAKKEFEQETGIGLESVIPLSSIGTPLFARIVKLRNFSFIGVPTDPLVVREQRLDKEEFLKTVLVSLNDWLKLIDAEKVDSHSVVTTFMALRYLRQTGRLY